MAGNMLASDDANTEFIGARNPDDAIVAEFYVKAVKNVFKSTKNEEQGLPPVFEDRVFVRYNPPGRTDLRIDVQADDMHKRRFHRQWQYFQANGGTGDGANGTPVQHWPGIQPSLAETLKALGFRTIEAVALASDEAINRLGMAAGMAPFTFRDKAKAVLGAAKSNVEAEKHAAEKEALQATIADLTAKVNQLLNQAPVATVAIGAAPAEAAPNAEDVMEQAALIAAYEAKFGKKPHHKMKAETIKERLAA